MVSLTVFYRGTVASECIDGNALLRDFGETVADARGSSSPDNTSITGKKEASSVEGIVHINKLCVLDFIHNHRFSLVRDHLSDGDSVWIVSRAEWLDFLSTSNRIDSNTPNIKSETVTLSQLKRTNLLRFVEGYCDPYTFQISSSPTKETLFFDSSPQPIEEPSYTFNVSYESLPPKNSDAGIITITFLLIYY
jgi:hypothetical protein